MKLFLTILLLSFYSISKAQEDSLSIKKNSIYIEILGVGGYGSVNFEREILKIKKIKIGTRLGITTYNLTDFTTKFNPDLIIPISINAQYGNKHNLEISLGQVISIIVETNPNTYTPERTTNIHPNLTVGYRYQKTKGGFIFRINYSPIIEFYQDYKHWGGISFGYAF
jgi:hypothetical protein